MSFRARQPGCACCTDDCLIPLEGWEPWTLPVPTVVGNTITFSSPNGLLTAYPDHPEDKSTHVVEVTVRGEDDGDILRVIVTFDTTDDYLYAEIEVGTVKGYLRLFQVTGGATYQLGSDVEVDDLAPAEDHAVKVCYDGSNLTAIITNKSIYSQSVTATGEYVGVATGAITDEATFTNFRWWIHYDDGGYYGEPNDCPKCGATCSACQSGNGPLIYKVVIAGYSASCPDSDCWYCSTINGTYFLTPDPDMPEQVVCFWRHQGTAQPCSNWYNGALAIWLQHEQVSENAYRTRVEILAGVYAGGTFTKTYSEQIDCETQSDENIPYDNSFACVTCDPSSATVTITSL